MLKGYAAVQEMARKRGVTERTVQTMCAEGKIEGVAKFRRAWAIPKDSKEPTGNKIKIGAYKSWKIKEK